MVDVCVGEGKGALLGEKVGRGERVQKITGAKINRCVCVVNEIDFGVVEKLFSNKSHFASSRRAKPVVVQFKLATKRNEVCAKEIEYS